MNQKIEFKFVIIILSILISYNSVSAQSKEERKVIEEKVVAFGDRFSEFMVAANTDSLVNFFSPNCHFLMEFESIMEKREEVEKYYKTYFKQGNIIKVYSLEREEVKVYDEIVLEIGVLELKYTKDGATSTVKYNYSFVWKESKSGSYQIRSAMWNLPANPCK